MTTSKEDDRREITAAQGAYMVAAGVMDPADLHAHHGAAWWWRAAAIKWESRARIAEAAHARAERDLGDCRDENARLNRAPDSYAGPAR